MTENALSIFQCGFRKKYSIQHALIAVIEKAKKTIDKSGTFGALLFSVDSESVIIMIRRVFVCVDLSNTICFIFLSNN